MSIAPCHRQVQGILREGFGIELSRGSINRMRQEVSEAVAAAVEQAQEYVQQQPVVHCDETGFAQGNQDGQNPDQRRGWLWVLVSPLVSVFVVALSRSQATAKQLNGATFDRRGQGEGETRGQGEKRKTSCPHGFKPLDSSMEK